MSLDIASAIAAPRPIELGLGGALRSLQDALLPCHDMNAGLLAMLHLSDITRATSHLEIEEEFVTLTLRAPSR
jgi:hypothetical protein